MQIIIYKKLFHEKITISFWFISTTLSLLIHWQIYSPFTDYLRKYFYLSMGNFYANIFFMFLLNFYVEIGGLVWIMIFFI